MNNNFKYDESTIIGSMMNRIYTYSGNTYVLSRFDQNGRKTDAVHSITYGDSNKYVRALAKGMMELGIKPHDRGAVFGPNSPMWISSVFAILSLRASFVPIYPSSKTDDVWWCIHDSGAKIIFCHSKEHLDKILEVKGKLGKLEWIIVMDPDTEFDQPGIMSYKELCEKGEKSSVSESEVDDLIRKSNEDDLAAIIYTSGTTGRPKGVMLTNKNFISQRSIAAEYGFTPDDIWLGHLPMCHSLGFSADLLNSGYQGGTLFVADSIKTEEMRANLRTCRPTVMTSVPRLWEKLYLQINIKVRERPAFVQNLVKKSFNVGKERFLLLMDKKPIPLKLKIKARLAQRIFRRIRKEAGLDRLKICVTGGGPIHPDLIIFFGAMGISLYQGYGLTETSPVTHACTPKNNKVGTVGKTIPQTECKLADDGEILVKGPQVMQGYLNNPQATKETFTEDGFFKTGDIGEIDEHGYTKITDRKKELIITSGGKNIAPQPVQEAFNTDPFIEQVYVTGDARKFLAALIVPNFPLLERWADENKINYSNPEELAKHDRVYKFIGERIDKINKILSAYETIKRFAVLSKEFSEEGGELTPTLKMKRKVIEEKYRDIIDSLFPKDEEVKI